MHRRKISAIRRANSSYSIRFNGISHETVSNNPILLHHNDACFAANQHDLEKLPAVKTDEAAHLDLSNTDLRHYVIHEW